MNKIDIDNFFERDVIIVFDTNMWLDIYRVLPDEIANILTLLNKPEIKNRLCVPAFVELEFEKHYQQLIAEHERIVGKVKDSLTTTISDFEKKTLTNVEELSIRHKLSSDDIKKKLKRRFANLKKIANEFLQYNETQNVLESNHITERVKLLFDECSDNNSMNSLDNNDILELLVEGEQRYARRIPPGFMDKSKEEKGKFIYGDLIIWKEIIRYAYYHSKDVVFVTNDVKKDWFEKDEFHSKLIDEFQRETKQKIIGLKGSEFYSYAKEKYLAPDETLSDIDTYIAARAEEFISNIESDLQDKVNNELYYSYGDENKIYNPWDILSDYDGTEYEYEDITDFDFVDVSCERESNEVTIYVRYKIEFSVETAGYQGRDDDTHEVIQSPYRHHKLAGLVTFIINKPADEFLFDLYHFDNIDILGSDILETEYDDGYDEDY